MKRNLSILVFFITVFLLVQNQGKAQYKQFNGKPADQTIKQKPYYGPEETIIANFWKQNPSLSFNVESATEIPYELGYVFQSSKNGQITQLAVRMPRDGIVQGTELTYTVSLWDNDSRQLLAQTNITTTDVRFTAKNLDNAVAIAANKKYVVSVFIRPVNKPAQTKWSYYSMIKPGSNNSAAAFLPLTSGSITLLNTQNTLTSSPAFPSTVGYHKDIVTGICDVIFVAREK
jgi:hypothetical protein